MLEYLIKREREENFRTSTRTLTFPDGKTRRIEAYRLVWAWFDRAIAFEYGPTEDQILATTLKCAAEEGLPLDQALGCVLNYYVQNGEAAGLDYTDHNAKLLLAKTRMRQFFMRRGKMGHSVGQNRRG